MCGWKDRCRDGNLRTYCQVSPILFGCFFAEASPTCFLHFCEMLFVKVRVRAGIKFWARAARLGNNDEAIIGEGKGSRKERLAIHFL